MPKKTFVILPRIQRSLVDLGLRLKTARLKRDLPLVLIAERAGISVPTLRALEKGLPSCSIGSLTLVLMALGLEKDLLKLAAQDELGDLIYESKLRKRASKSKNT